MIVVSFGEAVRLMDKRASYFKHFMAVRAELNCPRGEGRMASVPIPGTHNELVMIRKHGAFIYHINQR